MADSGQFMGLVALGATIRGTVVTKNTSGVPVDASPAPTYRVYGPAGVMTNGTGSLSAKDSGTVTGCVTSVGLIKITSNGHKLTTGTRVSVASVGGVAEATGDWNVTVVDVNNFTLDGSTFSTGPYTSGGTWHASGVYDFNYSPTVGNNFASGVNYAVLVNAIVGSNNTANVYTFQVT